MDLNRTLPAGQEARPEPVLDTSKTWSTAWRVFSSNWLAILLITLAIYIPLLIARGVIFYRFLYSSYGRYLAYLFMLVRVYLILLATLAIAVLTEAAVSGQKASFKQAVSRALSRYGQAVATSLVAGLIVLGYSFLLIIPGIVKMVQFAFINYAVVLRDLGGKQARQYSQKVARDRGWRIYGLLVLTGVLSWAAGRIVGLLLSRYLPGQGVLYLLADVTLTFFNYYFTVFFVVLFLKLEQGALACEAAQEIAAALPPISAP